MTVTNTIRGLSNSFNPQSLLSWLTTNSSNKSPKLLKKYFFQTNQRTLNISLIKTMGKFFKRKPLKNITLKTLSPFRSKANLRTNLFFQVKIRSHWKTYQMICWNLKIYLMLIKKIFPSTFTLLHLTMMKTKFWIVFYSMNERKHLSLNTKMKTWKRALKTKWE